MKTITAGTGTLLLAIIISTSIVYADTILLTSFHGDDSYQRWRDAPSNLYNDTVANTHDASSFYTDKSVTLSFHDTGNTFAGTLTATGLKPNFCYQLKLEGEVISATFDTASLASEALGYAGRWWLEIRNADGVLVETRNSSDSEYEQKKSLADPFSDGTYTYHFVGYLLFDGFVTDNDGDANVKIYLDSSYHVLWKSGQNMPSYSYPITTYLLDPDLDTVDSSGVPWYSVDHPAVELTIFGEIEHEDQTYNDEPGETILPDLTYPVSIVLTEESFHEGGSAVEGGYWASVMKSPITFAVDAAMTVPVAVDDEATAWADTPVTVDVLTNDINAVSVVNITQPAYGTAVLEPDDTVTYTPAALYVGTDTFSYTVQSAAGIEDTATVAITVQDTVSETVALAVEGASDTAAVADVLVSDDVRWRVTGGGETSFWFGALSLPTSTAVTKAVLFVEHHEDPGMSDGSVTWAVDCDAALAGYEATAAAPIRARSASEGTDAWDLSHVVTSVAQANDLIFTILNSHRKTSYLDHVFLEVTYAAGPPSDPPVADDDNYSTAEDTALTVAAPGVLINDSDPEGETLSVKSLTAAQFGTVAMASDGAFTYTPNADFAGTDTFTYTATDMAGGTDTATVTINVQAVNDPPIADPQNVSVSENQSVSIVLTGSDVDGDTLTFAVASYPSSGALSGTAPDLIYTPTAGFTGTDSFSFTVSDGNGAMDTAVVTIAVNPASIAPAIDYLSPNLIAVGLPADVTIVGQGFAHGATVILSGGAGPTPSVTNVVVVDASTIAAVIYAKDGGPPKLRYWDVTVQNPDGNSTTLHAGLAIQPQ